MTVLDPPGHRALRKGRVSIPGQAYLLTTVTELRTPWFLDPDLARPACRQMIDPATWGDATPLCWIFMPDHWHGLIELGDRDDLACVMNRFKALVSKRIREVAPQTRLWSHGFHDRALRRQDDVRAVARYVIANPVRAGLVARVGDYPYWDCAWM
ncbi:REP-associated tyrosine transposase [Dyella sp. KRB-257]|uniref:REP-associated tyrosine transposase n=1 Tax=Dyella sp. KRB-257 TaxID=3400915 RepID=UPI003C07998B